MKEASAVLHISMFCIYLYIYINIYICVDWSDRGNNYTALNTCS